MADAQKSRSVENGNVQELRKSIKGPVDLLDMTLGELAFALLGAMQQRRSNPLHPVSRNSAVSELNSIIDPISPMDWRRLEVKLEPLFRKAFDQLERWDLIEAKYGQSESSGYIVLTEKGIAATARVDYGNLRQRRLLVPEMMHPKLRGDVHADFLAGKFGKAVFGAFKIVEVEVRAAAGLTDADFRAQLMRVAFNEKNGPLTNKSEDPSQRKALRLLFEGSFGRFRIPEGHADRVFADPIEPMQELMLASRLLRLLEGDQRHV